jgi:hypothetical protein
MNNQYHYERDGTNGSPSAGPSALPSATPSSGPSAMPSTGPSSGPSVSPSVAPSASPSLDPQSPSSAPGSQDPPECIQTFPDLLAGKAANAAHSTCVTHNSEAFATNGNLNDIVVGSNCGN